MADGMKLDLGCGINKREGFVGVDISADCKADIVHDLRVTPWPFKDGEVTEVWCSHFFEHLSGPERMAFMDELYRVMKPGAQATLITPYWNSMRAIQDPTHAWPPVCEASYLYFNKGWREQNGLQHYPIKCDFDFGYGYALDGDWQVRSQESRQFALKHYNGVVNDLQVVLTRRE
jgi:hypothetical protein